MPRPIAEILRSLRNGTFLVDVQEALTELTKAVDETGKPGAITIKLTMKKATSIAVALTGEVTLVKPKEQAPESLFFPTPLGHLETQDPRQQTLPLQAVEIPSARDLEKSS
jgi:hypothetical protein